MSFHIPQYHYLYRSLADLSGHAEKDPRYHFHAQLLQVSELLAHKRLFITGEPGHGKTTLIGNFKQELAAQNIPFHEFQGFETPQLAKLGFRPYLVFDALDECKDFVFCFKQLVAYADTQGCQLVISTRSHYVSAIANLVENLDFVYAQILPFDSDQIQRFLEHHLAGEGYSETDISELINRSAGGNGLSVLRVPRYLNEFKDYILQHQLRPGQATALTKSQLFEKVIYFKLEDQHGKTNQVFLVKRVLERLSLLMEIFEVNQLSKEDFITFLDQARSNINLVFLGTGDIDELLNRDLKTVGENILFEHTEFQEYLAAKELLRLGNKFQTIFDLMVEPTLRIIPANWIDVLSFAIDMDPDTVRPLLAFIRSVDFRNIDEKMIKMILQVPAETLLPERRQEVFRVAFDFYSRMGKSAYDTFELLARFANVPGTPELVPIYAVEEITTAMRHTVNNQVLIIEALAKTGALAQEAKLIWTAYIQELLPAPALEGIRSSLLHAMLALQAKEALLGLRAHYYPQADYIFNDYLRALSDIAPNDPVTMELILDSLMRKRRLDAMEHVLGEVSEPANLIRVFEVFTTNEGLLNNLSALSFHHFYGLVEHCKSGYTDALGRAMEKFVLGAARQDRYHMRSSSLISGAVAALLAKRNGFVAKLLKIDKAYLWLDNLAPELVADGDLLRFKQLERYFRKHRAMWNFSKFVFQAKDRFQHRKSSELYSYVAEHFPTEGTQATPPVPAAPPEAELLTELRSYYLDEPTFYHTGLVPFFISNYPKLLDQLTVADREYIAGVVNMILSVYDPEKFTITIEEYKPNNISFRHNSETWFGIAAYFTTAYLVGGATLLNQYREKALKTLPRFEGFNSDESSAFRGLVQQLGSISEAETRMMLDFFNARTDDMLLMSVRSFSENIRVLGLKAFKPLLRGFISSEKVHLYEREEALTVFGELSETEADRAFLLGIFETQTELQKDLKLRDLANEFLIRVFADEGAIRWRFAELKRRMLPIDPDHRYNGTRSVSAYESEIDHPAFGKCFYGSRDPLVRAELFALLEHSFAIRVDRFHWQYSSYLQQICYAYLGSVLDAATLGQVKRTVELYNPGELAASFASYLLLLTTEFYNEAKQGATFLDAVLKYNRLLEQTYLRVGSNAELQEVLSEIVRKDITRLIEDEGFYRVSRQLSGEVHKRSSYINEELIQKTLKIAFEKALLENGFRKADILREVETYDGLRYDYVISYGLYGPVVVELKLLHNKEIQQATLRAAYQDKLKKYLRANHNLGLYIIFQTQDLLSHNQAYDKLKTEYGAIRGLEIMRLKCF